MSKPPPKGQIPSLNLLRPYLRPYHGRIILAALAVLFTSAAVLGMGSALRYLVDHGIAEGDFALLNRGYLALGGVILLLAFSSFMRYYLAWWLGERVIADIRNALFSHLLRMDVSYFETSRTGDLLSRITTDTTLLQTVITSAIPMVLRNVLLLTGGFTLLLLTSPSLTEYVLLMLPLVVAPILLLGRKVRGLSRETQMKVAEMNAHAEESINGIRTVQAMTMEPQAQAQFADAVQASLDAALSRIRLRGFLTGLVIFLVFGAVASVLRIGGGDVINGSITTGELSAFVFYAVMVAAAVGALSELVTDLQRAAGAAERIGELLALDPAVKGPENPMQIRENEAAALSFSNVSFHYPSRKNKSALENVSFQVQPGETVALVGPSGAGKTTVFQMILRFYDPESGMVSLNGEDVRNLELSQLRRHIGFVPQEPVIFSGNAWANIRAGRPDADEDDILAAADAAHVLEFMEKMPHGMQTHLGQKGVQLSGGQKQRIAIARAIIRKPSLLLLDEATSALDAESEYLVRQALAALMKGRTTLIIAHRLSTVINADRILLFNEGKLEAGGTHDQLCRESPLYARFVKLQWQHSLEPAIMEHSSHV